MIVCNNISIAFHGVVLYHTPNDETTNIQVVSELKKSKRTDAERANAIAANMSRELNAVRRFVLTYNVLRLIMIVLFAL